MSVHVDRGASSEPNPRARRRGWLALASLLAGFWWASTPAAAPAPPAHQPAPVAAPAAPIAPPAPATSCQTATLPQLTALLDRLPRESVVPATEIMPDNAESAVTYLHPNGA